ncbi:MAG: LamG-like jellyroll fold domain-containing protein [Leifsonia sp.]
MATAVRYGHKVVVDSKSSPTLLIQALPDGTMQAESDVVPARAKVGGVWTAIDTTLRSRDDGWLEPKVAAAGVRFGPGGTDDIAQIQSESGQWFSEQWPYGALPAPTIEGSHATYPEVFPGVDLRLTATHAGMSEVLVVKTAQAAANPMLADVSLAVEGATVQPATKARTLEAVTSASAEPVASATPLWWDSRSALSNADTPGGDEPRAVPTTSTTSTVSLDVQSVTATAPTYPLYIDPDWSSYLQADWYTDRAYPNQSYLDPPSDSVGYGIDSGVGYLSHAFFQFQTDFLAHKHVLNARFNIHQTYANSCDTTLVQLWEYGGSTSPGFTWNSEPNQWWYTDDAQGNANGGPCAPNPAWVGFSATHAAAAAAGTGQGNIQLGMRVANESNSLTRKHYDWNAQLVVTYNTPPANPASPAFTTPQRVCSSDPNAPLYVNNGPSQPLTLQVTQSDADGGNVNDGFYIYAANGSSILYQYGTGSVAQGVEKVQVPAGTIPPGAYKWEARAGDYTDLSPGFSTWCYFTVDNTGPAALPGVSIVSGPHTVGQPVTVDLTSDPGDQVSVFALYWATTAATTIPVTTSTALPTCPVSYAGGVTFVCPDAKTGAATVTVSPPDVSATLSVTTFDQAGNPPTPSPNVTAKPVSADIDAADVSDGSGHRWATDPISGSASTVADANPTSPVNLTVGSNAAWSVGDEGNSLSFPGYAVLDRYVIGSKHLAALEDASSAWTWEMALGQILRPEAASPAPAGMVPIYSCALGSGDMTSLSSTCEGTGVTGVLLGYIWSSAPSGVGSQAVYRCVQPANNDHFDSLQSNCEGQHVDMRLGYFLLPSPATTATAVVNPTQSFTVSAWLTPATWVGSNGTYTALSHGSGNNSDFSLGISHGRWQFCVRTPGVASSTPSDCAVGTVASGGQATFVTGEYDAVGHRVSISTGGSSVAYATVTHTFPTGTNPSPGGLIVGSDRWNHAPAHEWAGLINDPSIYQGIASSSQLSRLAFQTGPNAN